MFTFSDKWKSYFWFSSVFFLKSGEDFTSVIMLSCNPRSRSEVIMATHHTGNLNILLSLTVQILRSWLKRASLFHRWQGLFPKTPLLSPKRSANPASLFLTTITRKAADARNVLLFLMGSDARATVTDVFDFLYTSLGPARYSRLFSVILTDNRVSFMDPSVFERKNGRDSYTLIFCCNPMASWQKGRLVKNHEFIRYVLPKGTTFSELTQSKATRLANHINSTTRASLNGCVWTGSFPFK